MIPIPIKNKIVGEANWRSTNGHGGVDDITRDNFIQAAQYGYSLAQEEMAQSLRLYECQNNTIIKQQQEIERLKEENARLRRYLDEYDKDYAKRHGIV